MPKMVNIAGMRFGRLTAVERVGTKWGKALWTFNCDCGTKGFQATQNQVHAGQRYASGQRKGHGGVQSCGCWNKECLFFGPNPNRVKRPRFCVPITFPIPEVLYPDKSPEFNDLKRRMYQYRWERVEFEARKIERGTWKEPEPKKPFIAVDDDGNRIERIDLKAMATMKRRDLNVPKSVPKPCTPLVPPTYPQGKMPPISEYDLYGASSLADRVRIVP